MDSNILHNYDGKEQLNDQISKIIISMQDLNQKIDILTNKIDELESKTSNKINKISIVLELILKDEINLAMTKNNNDKSKELNKCLRQSSVKNTVLTMGFVSQHSKFSGDIIHN